VATISRLPKSIGLFCKRASYKIPYSAKETYIFKEPTSRSHPISILGWLRLVGSLKLDVSFAEYSLFYRALLQKRHIIPGSLLVVATPSLFSMTLWLICEKFYQPSCSDSPPHLEEILEGVFFANPSPMLLNSKVRCSVLLCVAVGCSVLQFVAVCCSALQCVAGSIVRCAAVCYSVLQCGAVSCSLLTKTF